MVTGTVSVQTSPPNPRRVSSYLSNVTEFGEQGGALQNPLGTRARARDFAARAKLKLDTSMIGHSMMTTAGSIQIAQNLCKRMKDTAKFIENGRLADKLREIGRLDSYSRDSCKIYGLFYRKSDDGLGLVLGGDLECSKLKNNHQHYVAKSFQKHQLLEGFVTFELQLNNDRAVSFLDALIHCIQQHDELIFNY
ncbi:hypothetical protein H4R33_001242 [Dimargaris cristalligena]|nr:hypothetical protein H4R33_001242 [Dimargaris cristalligena]